jgi:hypothetical protein
MCPRGFTGTSLAGRVSQRLCFICPHHKRYPTAASHIKQSPQKNIRNGPSPTHRLGPIPQQYDTILSDFMHISVATYQYSVMCQEGMSGWFATNERVTYKSTKSTRPHSPHPGDSAGFSTFAKCKKPRSRQNKAQIALQG